MKKLEVGKTIIDTLVVNNKNNQPVTYKILYGNLAEPKVNGITMHLSDAKYQEMLTNFLRSAEGEDYDPPTAEEIEALRKAVEADVAKQKSEMQEAEKRRKVAEAKAKEDAARAAQEASMNNYSGQSSTRASNSAVRADNADIKILQSSIDALTSQMNSIGSSIANLQINVSGASADDQEESDDEYEEDNNGSKNVLTNILLVIAIIIGIGSCALSGLSFMKMNSINQSVDKTEEKKSDKKETTTNTLVIDGQTYTIESSPVELADGETKVSMYAIATTNEDGKNVNKVIALGDVNISDIEKAAKASTGSDKSDSSSDTKEEKEGE